MPAKTTVIENHAAWIAEALADPFHRPRRLPKLRDAAVGMQAMSERQPGLWSQVDEELPQLPAPERQTTPQQPCQKRKEEKAGKSLAECLAALIEAKLVPNEYIFSLGNTIQDHSVPYTPRSLSFPLRMVEQDGVAVLLMSTPATRGPFVKHVENVTGLRAEWRPDIPGGTRGLWYHAVDLATDANWERLARTMWHTTPEDVSQAVGFHVASGDLSARNGRLLLLDIGVEEPEDRSEPELLAMRPGSGGGPCTSLSGWGAVHAFEDGWLSFNKRKRQAQFTDKARVRLEAISRDVPPEPAPAPAEPAPAPAEPAPLPPTARGMRRPTPPEKWWVDRVIMAALPEGVPTYAKGIVGIRRAGAVVTVDILLWDGAVGRLQISGFPREDGCGYRWHDAGVAGTAFHWDEAARSWVRLAED